MKLQSFSFRPLAAGFTALTFAFSMAVSGLSAAAPQLEKPGLSKATAADEPSYAADTFTQPLTQAAAEPDNILNQPVATNLQSALEAFVASLADGRAGVLRGVYVPGVLALRVMQQPAGAFSVDMRPGVATQFTAASAYGVTGLLADNIASGVEFFKLAPGQEVILIYGDGATRRYIVAGVSSFQALSPSDPYSDFVDLATGSQLSSSDLFTQMYSGGDKLTFQTCLAKDGLMQWGRLFVTAHPVT